GGDGGHCGDRMSVVSSGKQDAAARGWINKAVHHIPASGEHGDGISVGEGLAEDDEIGRNSGNAGVSPESVAETGFYFIENKDEAELAGEVTEATEISRLRLDDTNIL